MFKQFWRSIAAAVIAIGFAASASASPTTWDWLEKSANGDVLGSGSFTTAGPATSPELMSDLTGVWHGFNIVGLMTAPSNPNMLTNGFYFNNLFDADAPHLDIYGFVGVVSGGPVNFNIYWNGDHFEEAYYPGGNTQASPVATNVLFLVTQRVTNENRAPEPGSLALVAMALGAVAVPAVRRKRQQSAR